MQLAKSSGPLGQEHTVTVKPTPRFSCHAEDDPLRGEIESFIHRVYARRFGAQVRRFAPQLVCLRDRDSGQIVAAAGYRQASRQAPLFLERYLDRPIEQCLVTSSTGLPSRDGIFEVGHLSSERSGEGRRLIFMLAQHLATRQAQWVVSTLTEELRHLFVRLGITPLALGRADATALGDAAVEWGSYYEHHPVVLAGQMQQALRLLQRRQAVPGAAA
jgi:Thermostable hemolysin